MKQYKDYLIGFYGYKEAMRRLQKQYIFDKKTVEKIKEYRAAHKRPAATIKK